jgi:hypothetical protein
MGKFPNMVSGLIQWALQTVEMWCDELGLLVNPNKTGLVAFMRRKQDWACCIHEKKETPRVL